ncbi:unnamed protein product, partial [Meganyctiphanes norvegica]
MDSKLVCNVTSLVSQRASHKKKMVDQLTEKQLAKVKRYFSMEKIAEFKNSFSMIDKNNDGTITTKDMGTFFDCLGENPTEAELQGILGRVDADGNGTVDFPEFLMALAKHVEDTNSLSASEEDMKQAFMGLDTDGDGFISRFEFKEMINSLTDEEKKQILQEGDSDGDGKISYDEFVTLLTTEFSC